MLDISRRFGLRARVRAGILLLGVLVLYVDRNVGWVVVVSGGIVLIAKRKKLWLEPGNERTGHGGFWK